MSRKQTLDQVAATLEDADNEAAAEAVEVYPLIEGDSAKVARRLAARLLDGDPKVRRAAAGSIRYAVQPETAGREIAFRALIEALDDPDAGVRAAAARSLGEISFHAGHSDSFDPVPALHRKLGDPSETVRAVAALAMARDGQGEEAVPILLTMLQGHREENCPQRSCSVAFEALMVLAPRSDRATSGLIACVYRERRGRSSETLTTLAALVDGDFTARKRVISRARVALGMKDADLNLSASLVLVRIGECRLAIPGLVAAIESRNPKARPYVDEALRMIALAEPEEIRRFSADPTFRRETREVLRSLLPETPPIDQQP